MEGVEKRTSARGRLRPALAVLMLSTLVFGGISPVGATSSSPPLHYDGALTDANGVAYSPGNYAMTFRLFPALIGETAVWDETHQNVAVRKGGVFGVQLGLSTPFPDGLFDNATLFLEVQIGTGTPLSPRQELDRVPAAFYSDRSAQSAHANNSDHAQNAQQAEFATAAGSVDCLGCIGPGQVDLPALGGALNRVNLGYAVTNVAANVRRLVVGNDGVPVLIGVTDASIEMTRCLDYACTQLGSTAALSLSFLPDPNLRDPIIVGAGVARDGKIIALVSHEPWIKVFGCRDASCSAIDDLGRSNLPPTTSSSPSYEPFLAPDGGLLIRSQGGLFVCDVSALNCHGESPFGVAAAVAADGTLLSLGADGNGLVSCALAATMPDCEPVSGITPWFSEFSSYWIAGRSLADGSAAFATFTFDGQALRLSVLSCGVSCASPTVFSTTGGSIQPGPGIQMVVPSTGLPLVAFSDAHDGIDLVRTGAPDGSFSGGAFTLLPNQAGPGRAPASWSLLGMSVGADGFPILLARDALGDPGSEVGSVHVVHCSTSTCVPYGQN